MALILKKKRKGRPKGAISKARRLPAKDFKEPLKKVHRLLRAHGLEKRHSPSNDSIIAMIPKWIDWDKAREWAISFVKTSQG
ncbi:MAG TPA: hypothetical protein VHE30_27200 [Polyangiaceae bacterium]|nr:hypothetical protein [Polyangiaceae bacterium]